jgi:hypothetical protein
MMALAGCSYALQASLQTAELECLHDSVQYYGECSHVAAAAGCLTKSRLLVVQ